MKNYKLRNIKLFENTYKIDKKIKRSPDTEIEDQLQ